MKAWILFVSILMAGATVQARPQLHLPSSPRKTAEPISSAAEAPNVLHSNAAAMSQERESAAGGMRYAWAIRYNGQPNLGDVAYAMALDDSENVYITGYSVNKDADYLTIKYDRLGVKKWARRYNGPKDSTDIAYALAVDKNGNVYVGGCSIGANGNTDGVAIKYNSAGVRQWVARYNGPGDWHDGIFDIEVDDAGNVYATGYSYGAINGYDFITIKYNSTGARQWVARHNGSGNREDIAHEISVDAVGNVYVNGYSTGKTGNHDFLTVKYNSAGIKQWTARYNAEADSSDISYNIALDDAGNVYVAGTSYGNNGNFDYVTIKYNNAGAEQWVARYNGQGNRDERVRDLTVDAAGNVYVTGRGFESSGTNDYVTVKYDNAGAQQWVARYNSLGNGTDQAFRVIVDDSGNVYVTGYSYFGPDADNDYVTIKYNSAGKREWLMRFNSLADSTDIAYDMAISAAGNVHVTGSSIGWKSGNLDFLTVKYVPRETDRALAENGSIDQDKVFNDGAGTGLPTTFDLAQNFPNPFSARGTFGNPSTAIHFATPTAGRARLAIYNLRGELVRTLVDGELAAGYHRITFNARGLASGTYFYRFEAGDFISTRKMILQK
ncbi:SBBP repeat-containing protein [candidate division KSB1 bacterium]|nr:SBBP repeat-containing protein [candidate division KSB1 bacterium]